MLFFYVLINGVTWEIASKLIKNTAQYKSTLNRRFNMWVKDGIFSDVYNNILDNYKKNANIYELYIDSTDIMNVNCASKFTYKSNKLHKQAFRLSIIADNNKIPINRSLNKAYNHDSSLGLDLMITTNINKSEKIYVAGDKGYIMDDQIRTSLLKSKGFHLITPKKKYVRKRNSKSNIKRIRHSKQIKNVLNNRIFIEHVNNVVHRSYKKLSKIFDKSTETFNAFIDLAFSIITLQKLTLY